jgi:hypothetical protein
MPDLDCRVDDHPAYAGIDDEFSAIFQRRNLDTRQALASLARHSALTIRQCVPPAERRKAVDFFYRFLGDALDAYLDHPRVQ